MVGTPPAAAEFHTNPQSSRSRNASSTSTPTMNVADSAPRRRSARGRQGACRRALVADVPRSRRQPRAAASCRRWPRPDARPAGLGVLGRGVPDEQGDGQPEEHDRDGPPAERTEQGDAEQDERHEPDEHAERDRGRMGRQPMLLRRGSDGRASCASSRAQPARRRAALVAVVAPYPRRHRRDTSGSGVAERVEPLAQRRDLVLEPRDALLEAPRRDRRHDVQRDRRFLSASDSSSAESCMYRSSFCPGRRGSRSTSSRAISSSRVR